MAPVFTLAPAPVLGQKQAALLSGRWRQQLRRLIEKHQLDPTAVLESGTHPPGGGGAQQGDLCGSPACAPTPSGAAGPVGGACRQLICAASDAVGVAPTTTVVVAKKHWWRWDEQP
jgi:hypothetical protein